MAEAPAQKSAIVTMTFIPTATEEQITKLREEMLRTLQSKYSHLVVGVDIQFTGLYKTKAEISIVSPDGIDHMEDVVAAMQEHLPPSATVTVEKVEQV